MSDTETTKPAAVAKTPAPAKPTNAEIVEAWFQSEFPDTPVSHDTKVWNLVFEAKERLKEKLA